MPKKPIKPDRVRTPKEWWNAQILLCLSVVFMVLMAGDRTAELIRDQGVSVSRWILLIAAVAIMTPSVVHFRRVKRKWTKAIKDNGGLLCPNCAYVVNGSKEEGNGVTCAECGHYIEDWKGLHERWLKKLKWFG